MLNITLAVIISRAITIIFAFPLHEFAHAWMANRLGDPTARGLGRLTLAPRAHLDVMGTILVLAFGFGWAKPVPVNPRYLRYGPVGGMALVAIVGPLSNLALAAVGAIPFRLGIVDLLGHLPLGLPVLGFLVNRTLLPTVGDIFFTFVFLNIILFVFNLLPIAPLDGFRVALAVLPREAAAMLAKTERYGPLILIAVVFLLGGIFWAIIGPVVNLVARILIG
ncbi:MAG: site-2 protease family protein [Anaerolineae bacterium]